MSDALRGGARAGVGGGFRAAVALALVLSASAALLRPGRAEAQAPVEVPQLPQTQLPAPPPAPTTGPPSSPSGIARWFNPATAPFIPVPEIAVDPDSGTTVGLIPTWLETDENGEIRRIIAPDVIYNPYFGWGVHGRVYSYDSADEQWSVVGEVKQRVERGFNAQYQRGLLRESRWSFTNSLVFDRDGTSRFYGIGNDTPEFAQTNYTDEQALFQTQVGLNLNHAWQLQYTGRVRVVDVLPGTLPDIPSIQVLFPDVRGLGTNREVLNRVSIVYDTRDDLTVPTQGVEWVAYGGIASRGGVLNDSEDTEAGIDGRGFWSVLPATVLAAHVALRYLPTGTDLPFWALSSLGGGDSEIGGEQPLRGFGEGRFYDRDSFASSVELRHKIMSIQADTTHIDIELTPFIDVGRVFAHGDTVPFTDLHKVAGVGFRGIARPFVVGYVDVGYGSEGAAVFTGLNYPF